MVQYSSSEMDCSFAALSDATRRGVLERLASREASVTELADHFSMSLTGMKKHIAVLENSHLVITEKIGRTRTCRLGSSRLDQELSWLGRYRDLWTERFNEMDRILEAMKQKEQKQ